MTEDPFYTTPSRIAAALSCPLRYRRQYIEKIPAADIPTVHRFCGDLQHQALETWGQDPASVDPVRAYQDLWVDSTGAPLSGWLRDWFALVADAVRVDAELEVLAAKIAADRPDTKRPKATKEYRDAAEAANGGVGLRLARLNGTIDAWARGEDSPWRFGGYGLVHYIKEDTVALAHFAAWYDGLDDPPDIVVVESKATLEMGPRTMTGVIDAIYIWPDGTTDVVDYKRSPGGEDPISHFAAAATYALTAQQIMDVRPDRVVFHLLSTGRRLLYPVADDWTERLMGLVDRVKDMHDRDDFRPSFRTCAWCDYVSMCREDYGFNPGIEETR